MSNPQNTHIGAIGLIDTQSLRLCWVSSCLSVCLSAFALAWWLVCGWLAILPLACDLRTTSVPSDFFALGYPLAFLALDFSLALRVWAANL